MPPRAAPCPGSHQAVARWSTDEAPSSYSYTCISKKKRVFESLVVVQSLSCVQLFVTPWAVAHQASLPITINWSLLNSCVNDAIQPSHPLLPPSFPALNLSQHQGLEKSQLFSSGGQNIGISASASDLSSEFSGLISFRMDWFDLLAVKESSPAPQSESVSHLVFNLLWKLRDLSKKSIVILWMCGCVSLIQDLSNGLIHRESWWDSRILENVTYTLYTF